MTAAAKPATKMTVPRLAGNLPRITHSCPWKYLRNPISNVKILMARKVAPKGFPIRRNARESILPPSSSAREVLSRNSCVTATPMDAKASEVRSQARNVRSIRMLFPTQREVISSHAPMVIQLDRPKPPDHAPPPPP
ncbi:hypothetical protein CDD80_7038 [Ophiocordyceps camponoti-rufipedis]|uniref:Uncharacterized protein n=1 Tax=Ophiocordyceps camponoti-rufipedis TaxID=2004952 RepID=A0A2C5ZF55_9HYPO|nr:hypothetical protein CDD80_7038 [Ophiocordyceps camponoti-rufipedis]